MSWMPFFVKWKEGGYEWDSGEKTGLKYLS